MEPEVTEDVAREAMKAAGLLRGWTRGATHTDNPVTSYSGGWRMETQLTDAELPNADVLMLTEPTGHSDVNDMGG